MRRVLAVVVLLVAVVSVASAQWNPWNIFIDDALPENPCGVGNVQHASLAINGSVSRVVHYICHDGREYFRTFTTPIALPDIPAEAVRRCQEGLVASRDGTACVAPTEPFAAK